MLYSEELHYKIILLWGRGQGVLTDIRNDLHLDYKGALKANHPCTSLSVAGGYIFLRSHFRLGTSGLQVQPTATRGQTFTSVPQWCSTWVSDNGVSFSAPHILLQFNFITTKYNIRRLYINIRNIYFTCPGENSSMRKREGEKKWK